MTKDRLKEIEARLENAEYLHVDAIITMLLDDTSDLIAEVRRLQDELEAAHVEMCNLSE